MQMASAVLEVLARLEQRSTVERPELERLNNIGAQATRAAAGGLMLDVGPEVGRLLNALARIVNAQNVVEIGGSIGYSTVWIAEALSHTGGHAVTVEPNQAKADQLQANLVAAGLDKYVDVVVDDAAAVIPGLTEPLDLVLIDHWKDIYIREFDSVWPKLRTGGVIVADNVLRPAATADLMRAYIDHVGAVPGAYSFTLDIGDGVEITWRTHPAEA